MILDLLCQTLLRCFWFVCHDSCKNKNANLDGLFSGGRSEEDENWRPTGHRYQSWTTESPVLPDVYSDNYILLWATSPFVGMCFPWAPCVSCETHSQVSVCLSVHLSAWQWAARRIDAVLCYWLIALPIISFAFLSAGMSSDHLFHCSHTHTLQ